MFKSGYKPQTANCARAIGSEMEAKPNITKQIEDERLNIFDKAKVTEEYVLEGLNKIAINSKQDANRLRALELLGKYKAMFTDKTEVSGHVTHSKEEEDEYNDIKNRVSIPQDVGVKLN